MQQYALGRRCSQHTLLFASNAVCFRADMYQKKNGAANRM
jgi:hypothetical protein